MAMRERRFSRKSDGPLAEGTVRGTISFVSSSFRDNGKANQTKDEDGDLTRVLSRLYRAFRNKDPNPKQQKALPAQVLVMMYKNNQTESQKAIGQLGIGAFFWAMRSCEYLKVPQAEKRRTDILRLRNIRFFLEGVLLCHDDPRCEFATSVAITFEFQKKDERNDTVTQKGTDHAFLSPVKIWHAIVKRIRSYPKTNDDTPVSAVWRNGRIQHVTSKDMMDSLRAAAKAVGEAKLGFKISEIGTHSLRSGAAMAMSLDQIPVYVIMVIGRWSSDAFLKYIRKQVEQFSHNVAKRMIKNLMFRHIPEVEPRVSHLDPRQRNHPDGAETRNNVGGNLSRHVTLPLFSQYH